MLPEQLRQGLDQLAARHPLGPITAATGRLIDRYQADRPAAPGRPIVDDETAATAYALYRMPATFAAARAALAQAAAALPGFAPRTHCDLGGGTGGVGWAVARTWPSVTQHRVIEQSPAMIELGRRLAAGGPGALGRTAWTPGLLTPDLELPQVDLITTGYVLGELDQELRRTMITAMAAAADTVAVIEPGTKAGYRRILQARDDLIRLGLTVVAPCPHDAPCPMPAGDWCHFSVRVNRSATHRMIKSADRSYEDEKFSYVVASRHRARPARNRVLRHPRFAKGRVALTLCRTEPAVEPSLISKRDRDAYRAARQVEWGDPWP